MPWVDIQCVIVEFSGHTYLLCSMISNFNQIIEP